jgi:uncharacterized protein
VPEQPAVTGPAPEAPDPADRLQISLPFTDDGAGAAAAGLPITGVPTDVVAFIGRALKGPVNQPVRVTSFAAYQQVFGGLWQPSTLAYAIEQFFEHGGREAVVVRVCSGGRAPSLDLAAGQGTLVLAGVCPGSREFLRASVDYDGIPPADTTQFNLVVQRVRTPGSELVEEQEIFRRLSTDPESPRAVAKLLATSRLVRVASAVPRTRPDITRSRDPRHLVGYVSCNADGDDGTVLSDYDLIGSERDRSGLFALEGGPGFALLCIPPLARDRDIGASTLVVAARFCRRHHALLLVDPPQAWTTAGCALDALRSWPFHSHDAVMFFPRVLAFDRLRGRFDSFGCSPAAAGMITSADRARPHWWSADRDDTVLRPGLRPAAEVSAMERSLLAHHGVNCLTTPGQLPLLPARTLGGDLAMASVGRLLAARRLALYVAGSIERGTRWVVFEHHGERLRERVAAQVRAFLDALVADGAFGRGGECFVFCDERLNGPVSSAAGEFRLLAGYVTGGSREVQAWLFIHRPGGSESRQVSVNRYAAMGGRVTREIEAALLPALARGL